MSGHREIEKLLSFYTISAYQDMKSKDLFKSEGELEDSSEDEETKWFGISEGTVYLFCKGVIFAIFSLKRILIKWPTGEAKHNTHEGFKNIGGMENIIGAIDGSHIGLANAPLRQPETYWNRKKRYSIQLQGIVHWPTINIWIFFYMKFTYKNSQFYVHTKDFFVLIN
ncbi:hypothetical protein C1645_820002 [Glomus cerebriforme]|uniref:DDE Tnp4 domain-containing protein n=1 Tax=Glomus cerebriforme TaxID=658196 RepID=A0A397T3P3_9GLOM|nr:hypothetical protein C1645_820002 [Glomus cerebriforme]